MVGYFGLHPKAMRPVGDGLKPPKSLVHKLVICGICYGDMKLTNDPTSNLQRNLDIFLASDLNPKTLSLPVLS